MRDYSKKMSSQKVNVICYSGYRGEEIPRVLILEGKRIEVIEILTSWVEEELENRSRKRFFKFKGSDGNIYKIYYDEKTQEWYDNPKEG